MKQMKPTHYLFFLLCLLSSCWYGHTYGRQPVTAIQEVGQTPSPRAIPPEQSGLPVPILYYHAVNDLTPGIRELYVSPTDFSNQLQYLKENGYTVIPLEELQDAGRYHKPVVITFDDGYEDNYNYAYPLLKRFHYPATIFICSGFIDKPYYLKSWEIKRMVDLISFQSHTVTHPFLTDCSDTRLTYELKESQRTISRLTGRPVEILAYPTGKYDSRVVAEAVKYYKMAVLMGGGIYHTGDDLMAIKRVYVYRGLGIQEFARRLQDACWQ